MAHPKLTNRKLLSAGAVALLSVPFGGAAFALGLDTVTDALPEPVSVTVAPVEEAAAPVVEPVTETVAPAVDDVVDQAEAATGPLPDLPEPIAEILGQAPETGGSGTQPKPANPSPVGEALPVLPATSSPAPTTVTPAAPASASPTAAAATRAFRMSPSASTPSVFNMPALAEQLLSSSELPNVAGPEATATPISGLANSDAPAWLLATAAGLMLLVGAGHVLAASGKLGQVRAL